MKKFIIALIFSLIIICQLAIAEPAPKQFDYSVFKERRQTLCDSLVEGVAILYAEGDYGENGFRSDGYFFYLTGLNEPGAILMLTPGFYDEQILLLPPRDADKERWTGFRLNLNDSLKTALGFDQISRTGSLGRRITSCMKKTAVMHMISRLRSPSSDISPDLEFYRKVSSRVPGATIKNASHFLEKMRMIKSPDEIKAIEKAIAITHKGLTDLLAGIKPGVYEYQLDGILQESFKKQDARYMAFSAIVGTGKNGAILHYDAKEDTVKAGDLLLLDVGAEWNYYCADISRTVPIDGKFNKRQAELYDLVLKAQQAAIDIIKPGVLIRDVHEAANSVFRDAGYVDYYFHGTSHHLGLDVHDSADRNLVLEPGMVFTVEPGLYIDKEGIGIRIEDDVLVTENGSRVLSKDIPKTIKDVENWVQQAQK